MNTPLPSRPFPTPASAGSAEELRQQIYGPEKLKSRKVDPELVELFSSIPDQSLVDLAAFALKHQLVLTPDVQEVMLRPRQAGKVISWEIVCHPIGFCKIARRTGLFRPGNESIAYVDDGLVVTAQGYYRESTSDPWQFSTSAFAHAHTYAEMATSDEGRSWIPTVEWRATPEVRLAEIARVLCIQNAIPEQMAQFRVSGVSLESLRRLRSTVF